MLVWHTDTVLDFFHDSPFLYVIVLEVRMTDSLLNSDLLKDFILDDRWCDDYVSNSVRLSFASWTLSVFQLRLVYFYLVFEMFEILSFISPSVSFKVNLDFIYNAKK